MEWTFHNDLELVFVAVYQRVLQLLYVEQLLDLIKQRFVGIYGDAIRSKSLDLAQPLEAFDQPAERLRLQCEAKAQEAKQSRSSGPRRFEDTEKGRTLLKEREGADKKKSAKKKKNPDKNNSADVEDGDESDEEAEDSGDAGGEDGTKDSESTESQTAADGSNEGAVASSSSGQSSAASADDMEATIMANRQALLKKKGTCPPAYVSGFLVT